MLEMNADNHQKLVEPNEITEIAKKERREEALISLLEERLLVDRNKRKVGEVVVRKTIETRMVEVPVRWEKLIVEQVGDSTRQLAEIDLGHGEVTGDDLDRVSASLVSANKGKNVVSGEFVSLKAARDLLSAIATQATNGYRQIRIELTVDDEEQRAFYQKMFDRATGKGEEGARKS
jgi:hypothetical protein